MQQRYSIETSQDHPKKSGILHVDMLESDTTEICNLRFSGYATTLSRSAHQCQASMPQGLNASIELGAGGMRAQPVKIRRPLRSNGQRVVNHTQKLPQIHFANANTSVTCSARY